MTHSASDDRPARPAGAAARTVLVVGMVVLVALTVLAGMALVTTNARTDDTRATLAASQADADGTRRAADEERARLAEDRQQLAGLVRDLDQARTELSGRTQERDQLAATVDSARARVQGLSAAYGNQALRVFSQALNLNDLRTCLQSSEAALNLAAHGESDGAVKILDQAKNACQQAEQFLRQQGIA